MASCVEHGLRHYNPNFGRCGYDHCQGDVWDVQARVQTYTDRLNISGFDRTKSVCTTPPGLWERRVNHFESPIRPP
ncbi:hypothetical protein BDR03DRAFT_894545 [Suillus americanus]|nr:hypothetical protein BDR03DRAFT_894545 [Suillus americanus]